MIDTRPGTQPLAYINRGIWNVNVIECPRISNQSVHSKLKLIFSIANAAPADKIPPDTHAQNNVFI